MSGELFVRAFARDLAKNLFPANEFYKSSVDDAAYINAAKVDLPQSGSKPNVVKDRATLPATINSRPDTAEEYAISEFTTDPILIKDTEELIVNYGKRANVLDEHIQTLNTNIADNFANIWLPNAGSAAIFSTSGDLVGAENYGFASGTQRRRLAKADFLSAMNKLNADNVPGDGRVCVIPSYMYGDLLLINEFTLALNIGTPNLINGAIGRLFGFDIFTRSYVGYYATGGAKKAVGAAVADTDSQAAMFWHPNFVRRAEGTAKVYANEGRAEYYGGIFSAMVRAGGRTKYSDARGVVAIKQAQS